MTSDYEVGELVWVAGRDRKDRPVVVQVKIVEFLSERHETGADCVTLSTRGERFSDSRRLYKDPQDAAVAAMKGKK